MSLAVPGRGVRHTTVMGIGAAALAGWAGGREAPGARGAGDGFGTATLLAFARRDAYIACSPTTPPNRA